MTPVSLEQIANQSFTFNADGQQYAIDLRSIDDLMYMTVTMNGAIVANSLQCLPRQMIIPYAYLEGAGGNFIFDTVSGNNPQWKNFGASDVLLYATAAEMVTARADNAAALIKITLASNQAN